MARYFGKIDGSNLTDALAQLHDSGLDDVLAIERGPVFGVLPQVTKFQGPLNLLGQMYPQF